MARAALVLNGLADRKMYLCDSFEGLPAARADSVRQDENHYQGPTLKKGLGVGETFVLNNFAAFGMGDIFAEGGVGQLVKGYFVNSLPPLRRALLASHERLAILRMDGDMYDSTVDILYNLYDRVVVGGFIIIDDFGWFESERPSDVFVSKMWGACQAVMDFRAMHNIEDDCHAIHNIDNSGAWFRKCRDVTVKYEDYTRNTRKILQPNPPITGKQWNDLLHRWEKLGFGKSEQYRVDLR